MTETARDRIDLSHQVPPPPFFTPTCDVTANYRDWWSVLTGLPFLYSLYVHIPFCATRCRYCCLSQALLPDDRVDRYLDRVNHHMLVAASAIPSDKRQPTALFLGGGTPTAIAPAQLATLLRAVNGAFDLSALAESTIETTVDAVLDDHGDALLEVLSSVPIIGRVSVGVQTFQAWRTTVLGRRSSPDRVIEALLRIDKAGLTVSVDLMHGVPGVDPLYLVSDAKLMLELPVSGVELNAFVCQPGTGFAHLRSTHRADARQEQARLEAFVQATELLGQGGFTWNTPSHLSRSSRNSFVYENLWHHGDSCLAFGSGVKGRIDQLTYFAVRNVDRFNAAGEMSETIGSVVMPRQGEAFYERLVSRLMFGQFSVWHLSGFLLQQLGAQGLILQRGNEVYLTPKGRYYVANIAKALAGGSVDTRAQEELMCPT